MTALPADIAKFTTDGVLLTKEDSSIKANHIDAQESGTNEIEMFFVSATHAQILLDERFAIQSRASPLHEGIETDESLVAAGTAGLPLTPSVPCVQVVDPSRGIDKLARVRALAYDGDSDRYSVEVLE